MSRFPTKCDSCRMPKTPIIYVRTSRKLCTACWQAERKTSRSLIDSMPDIVDKEPPLGYNFIVNDYFTDAKKGRVYADWIFHSMNTALS